MRIIYFSFLMGALFGFLSIAQAQQSIAPPQAANFIGREMTVCGPVSRAYYARDADRQPTTLSLGGTFLNQYFAALIWGANRGEFKKPPESLYAGKQICVTGTIEAYGGSPVIMVVSPKQIEVK